MAENIIANILGRFWSIISGFLFIPLYIKFLGFENYAIISFTLIIAGMMAVLDAGLTATLSREFARQDQLIRDKIRIFTTLETCYFLVVFLTGIVVSLFSDFISTRWLNLKVIDPERVSFFIKIIGFEAGAQMLFRFYMGGILGFEKQVKANIYQIGWGIFRNGFVVLAIYFVPSLEMFFIWQLVSSIIFTILIRISLLAILNGKYTFSVVPALEKEVFLKIWRFAGGMLLISLVASLNTQMDKLAISKLLDITTLGYYTLAISIAMVIHVLVNPISVALLPRFTALYSKGDRMSASELYKKINLFVAVLLFSCMANMIFHGNDLIWIWTGNAELSQKAGIFLPVLSVSFAMLALVSIPYDVAIANGYTRLNNILGIMSLFVTIPGYWIATRLYGGIGAAYVFCFVQTIITFSYMYGINKRYLNISLYELFARGFFFPLIICMSFAYGLSFAPNLFEESRIFTFVRFTMITGATLTFAIFIFVPHKELRKHIRLVKKII